MKWARTLNSSSPPTTHLKTKIRWSEMIENDYLMLRPRTNHGESRGRSRILFAAFVQPLVYWLVSAAGAQPATVPTSQPVEPQRASVGLYINDVYELDLKKGTYIVDFYVWLRWRGSVDPTDIEFLNG